MCRWGSGCGDDRVVTDRGVGVADGRGGGWGGFGVVFCTGIRDMSAANFSACLAFTLQQEGGWSDRADDPGGATNQGVTLATFREFTNNPAADAGDLAGMTDPMRDDIYRWMFWRPIVGDALPAGVDLCVFDFAVNAGPGRSAKVMQEALGVTADGAIGPITLAAASATDPAQLVRNLTLARLAYYAGLGKPEFTYGWLARTRACEAAALGMVTP